MLRRRWRCRFVNRYMGYGGGGDGGWHGATAMRGMVERVGEWYGDWYGEWVGGSGEWGVGGVSLLGARRRAEARATGKNFFLVWGTFSLDKYKSAY